LKKFKNLDSIKTLKYQKKNKKNELESLNKLPTKINIEEAKTREGKMKVQDQLKRRKSFLKDKNN
jgi:hypothetical protein